MKFLDKAMLLIGVPAAINRAKALNGAEQATRAAQHTRVVADELVDAMKKLEGTLQK